MSNLKPDFTLSCQADVEQLKALWYYCFPEDRQGDFIAWYFANCYNPETTYVAKVKDKIVASVYAPCHQMVVRDRVISVPYIQGVAVSPDFRGQGLAKNLLNFALDKMAEQKTALAVLKPFDSGFYGALGWSFFAYLFKYKLPLSQLSGPKPNRDLNYLYTAEPWAYTQDLAKVYQAWMQNNLAIDSYVLRSEEVWQRLLIDHRQDDGEVLLAYNQGQPVGYMLYSLQGDSLFIRELAYSRKEALSSLLAFARDHGSQAETVLLATAATDNARLLLQEVLDGIGLYPFAMAKLLDIAGAFSGLPATPQFTEPIYLQVSDPKGLGEKIIKLFAVRGKIEAEYLPSLKGIDQQRIIAIEINLLTKAYMGCYNFIDYKRNDLVIGCEEVCQVMSGLLPALQSYFYEYI